MLLFQLICQHKNVVPVGLPEQIFSVNTTYPTGKIKKNKMGCFQMVMHSQPTMVTWFLTLYYNGTWMLTFKELWLTTKVGSDISWMNPFAALCFLDLS